MVSTQSKLVLQENPPGCHIKICTVEEVFEREKKIRRNPYSSPCNQTIWVSLDIKEDRITGRINGLKE